MSLKSLLSRWRADPTLANNFAAWETLPAQAARLEPFPHDLHDDLQTALPRCGITSLYSHQAEALRQAWSGKHVILVTRTASGKTLGYNLPVIDALLRNQQARALYLFPTKALAQDQLSNLRQLLTALPGKKQADPDEHISTAIYDGDTPAHQRPAIRKTARIILTNPDMLHTGILPHHTAWMDLFHNLHFVVIDEMHIYRGVFGSHVSNVIRRLRRVALHYGSMPQFVLTSATIGNPNELASNLVGPLTGSKEIALIDQDGAAHGEKFFMIYNPPVIDVDLGLRQSAFKESIRLATDLLSYNIQTILFARTRRSVELLLMNLRDATSVPRKDNLFFDQTNSIRGYRSGYLPQQRREIESGLRTGEVRAVVATTALELGIDIGAMGAALLVGYPGSIAATWQQAGRAGRNESLSLAILITTADPLDQFLAAHPDYFFDRSPEQALINPDNLMILLAHIRCAAFELPFNRNEGFGNLAPAQLLEFLDFLVEQKVLHASADKYFWMADQYPAQSVSLRSATTENILLQTDENGVQTIGEVDRVSALWLVHPNAIYLHEGQTYFVQGLDLEKNVAKLKRVETDYYTEDRSETTVDLTELVNQEYIPGGIKFYGEIRVTRQVIGYNQVHWQTRLRLGTGELDLPPTELQTTAYWIALSEETVASLQEQGLWNNEPNDYGPTWARQKDRARSRDEFRCRVCGAPELGRAHDVHHINPFRTYRTAEIANQLENLVTLCPNCHRRVETNVRVRSGLAGLGFVLGHLSPLFLMCDSRDLGVQSDPQSSISAGRPAVVLYDMAPAGIGLSQRLFEIHSDLIGRARELIIKCQCLDGCPSCVGPGGENGQGSKAETLAILELLS